MLSQSVRSNPWLISQHYCWATWYQTSLWPVWISSPSSVHSQLLAHPQFHCGQAAGGAEKSTALCQNALQQLKHKCVIDIVLTLNPKQCTISATRKKTNSAHVNSGYLPFAFSNFSVWTGLMYLLIHRAMSSLPLAADNLNPFKYRHRDFLFLFRIFFPPLYSTFVPSSVSPHTLLGVSQHNLQRWYLEH